MALTSGTRLGPYEILAPVGAGGMGEVYSALDTRLGRHVAIKVLPEHLAQNPVELSRFERASKALAALSHPNLLALYDAGEEQGISYVVTELLEGETLRERLKKGAMPWPKAAAVAAAVADGLSAAHTSGVIHRDLKPENLFLTSEGRVKILDFGLARVMGRAAAQSQTSIATESQPGTVLGTAGYMSPEQVRGEAAEAPSDIFSFGCVLYEMLAGKRAFARETSAQTMTAILEAEPAALPASVPAELARVVEHCLEKKPQQRFQSAHDLTFALRDVGAAPESRRRRVRPLWWTAAMAIVLAAAAAYWMTHRGEAIDSLAILPFANAGDPNNEYLSDGITENLINDMSQFPALRVSARSLAFRYKGPQADPQKAGRDLHVRAVLTGRVTERDGVLNVQAELMRVSDGAQFWGRQYRQSLSEILPLQEEIARDVSGKLRLARPAAKRATENTEAYQLYLRGRYYWNRRTEQTLRRAVDYFQQSIDKDPTYALAYAALADCYAVYNSYQVEPPRESAPKAKAAAVRALDIDNTLAQAHASLGMIRMSYEWDWAGAEREFQRAIELDPNYATARHWYGISLIAGGRWADATASLKRAQQLDPLSLIINADAALELIFERRYDDAIGQLRSVLEMDSNFATGHRHLGMAYEQKGMYREGVAEFQRAVEISGGSPFALGYLGHAYGAWGKTAQARETVAELSALSKERYVPPFDFAVIYAGMKNGDRALAWLKRALDDRSLEMIFLKVDPRFDTLHNDPRFVELLRAIGL